MKLSERFTFPSDFGERFIKQLVDVLRGVILKLNALNDWDWGIGRFAIFPKTKNAAGIKVDTGTPTYPWHDMIGAVHVKTTGAAAPTFGAYRGVAPNIIQQYFFSNAVAQEIFFEFHILHDYAPGTDLFIHTHWSCNVAPTGNCKWSFDVSYAKGHNQGAFSAPITTFVTQASSGTQYQHMIAEVQLSAASPSATQLDSDDIEVDGIILVRVWRDAGDAADTLNQVPFLHFVDVHYMSTGLGTKNKAPDFWA